MSSKVEFSRTYNITFFATECDTFLQMLPFTVLLEVVFPSERDLTSWLCTWVISLLVE